MFVRARHDDPAGRGHTAAGRGRPACPAAHYTTGLAEMLRTSGALDTGRAAERFGFESAVQLRAGLTELVEWYRREQQPAALLAG